MTPDFYNPEFFQLGAVEQICGSVYFLNLEKLKYYINLFSNSNVDGFIRKYYLIE